MGNYDDLPSYVDVHFPGRSARKQRNPHAKMPYQGEDLTTKGRFWFYHCALVRSKVSEETNPYHVTHVFNITHKEARKGFVNEESRKVGKVEYICTTLDTRNCEVWKCNGGMS